MKTWIIRPIYSLENTLKRIHYPDANTPIQNISGLQVFYKIPEYVKIFETDALRVGYWDAKVKQWLFDGIDEIKFERSSRMLSFYTIKLLPLAFLMDRSTDFPYKKWYIRCVK